jgi:hypothetical protein
MGGKKLSQIKESNSNANAHNSIVSNPQQRYVSANRASELLDGSELDIVASDEDSVDGGEHQKSQRLETPKITVKQGNG